MRKESVLISICIISYNSANTILDTLNSLKNQTNKFFEIVVSDDCSTDSTEDVVQNWIAENANNFANVVFTKPNRNLGISANLNHCIRHSTGQYVKPMGADDLLAPIAIEAYTSFINKHNSNIIMTNVIIFKHEWYHGEINSDWEKHELTQFGRGSTDFFKLSQHDKYLRTLYSFPFQINGICIKKSLFSKIGYFDERYYQEDYPFLIKSLKSGYDIDFIPQGLVYYRVSDFSFTSHARKSDSIVDLKKYENSKELVQNLVYPEWESMNMYFMIFKRKVYYKFMDFLFFICNNKKGIVYKVYTILNYIFNVRLYKHRVKKLLYFIKKGRKQI